MVRVRRRSSHARIVLGGEVDLRNGFVTSFGNPDSATVEPLIAALNGKKLGGSRFRASVLSVIADPRSVVPLERSVEKDDDSCVRRVAFERAMIR